MNARLVSKTDATNLAPEQYELQRTPAAAFALSRRGFIKRLGGGLAVLLVARPMRAADDESGQAGRAGGVRDATRIDAWLHIGADGVVTVFTGKAEVGQNIRTSLAQAVADRGIRVNCVAPGPVWTPLIPATLERDHVDRFGSDTLWKRPAQPAEIAPSYVFLASHDGRYYSGEVLAPTGRAVSR